MTYSVRDLADQIAADRQQAEGLQPGIRARKDETEAIIAMAREMGLEGGSYLEQLLKTVDELDEAEALRLEVEGILEKARFMAMSAITGTYGTGSGNYAVPVSPGAVNNSKTGDRPPSGQELLDQTEDSPRSGRYNQLMSFLTKKGDDVGDSVLKPAVEHVYTAKAVSDADQQPPEFANTSTSTQVADDPITLGPTPVEPGTASAFVGVLAMSIVAAKGAESSAKTINQLWRTWK